MLDRSLIMIRKEQPHSISGDLAQHRRKLDGKYNIYNQDMNDHLSTTLKYLDYAARLANPQDGRVNYLLSGYREALRPGLTCA